MYWLIRVSTWFTGWHAFSDLQWDAFWRELSFVFQLEAISWPFLPTKKSEIPREFCWWRCKDILKPVRRIMPRCLYLSAHLKMFHQLIQNLRFIYIGVFRDISGMTIAKWCLIISSQSNLTRSIRNNVYFVTFRRHSWHLLHTKSPV